VWLAVATTRAAAVLCPIGSSICSVSGGLGRATSRRKVVRAARCETKAATTARRGWCDRAGRLGALAAALLS
jgi:hypothetical protein